MAPTKSKIPDEYQPVIYYSGVFDYEKLVKTIASWYGGQGYEFAEKVYKHKVPTPAGSEQEFKMDGWRKVTEYVQFWIYIHCHIWTLKEVDVIIDGKKKKMAKGRIQIRLASEVVLDYNNYFNTPATEKIQKFLHKHVWYKQITGGWDDEAYYRMYKLHRVIKETLNMSTPTNAADIRY